MSVPESIADYKLEIARYLDAFARSLPTQIDAPQISRVKLPGTLTWYRESLFWRFTEIAQDALQKLNEERYASAILLTRAAVETTAALWYLEAKIKRALESRDIAELDEKAKRLLVGSKDPIAHADGLPEAINVNTFVKHVAERIEGFQANYDALCEYVHPNHTGVAGLYSEPHADTRLIDLGTGLRGPQRHDVICTMSLNVAVIMFHHSYEAIADALPALVKLCEKLIPPIQN